MARTLSTPAVRRRIAPMPMRIEPMLATLTARLPSDANNWSFEFKWDGVRALCFADGANFSLLSRNMIEIAQRYPELREFHRELRKRRVILDGEIVALDAD